MEPILSNCFPWRAGSLRPGSLLCLLLLSALLAARADDERHWTTTNHVHNGIIARAASTGSPIALDDSSVPGGRNYLGKFTLSYALWSLSQEPVHDYIFVWEWLPGELVVGHGPAGRVTTSDLAKYPDLAKHFASLKPLSVTLETDIQFYDAQNALVGFGHKTVKPDIIGPAGGGEPLHVPGSPHWEDFFRKDPPASDRASQNKKLFQDAARVQLVRPRLAAIEWPEASLKLIADEFTRREAAEKQRQADALAREPQAPTTPDAPPATSASAQAHSPFDLPENDLNPSPFATGGKVADSPFAGLQKSGSPFQPSFDHSAEASPFASAAGSVPLSESPFAAARRAEEQRQAEAAERERLKAQAEAESERALAEARAKADAESAASQPDAARQSLEPGSATAKVDGKVNLAELERQRRQAQTKSREQAARKEKARQDAARRQAEAEAEIQQSAQKAAEQKREAEERQQREATLKARQKERAEAEIDRQIASLRSEIAEHADRMPEGPHLRKHPSEWDSMSEAQQSDWNLKAVSDYKEQDAEYQRKLQQFRQVETANANRLAELYEAKDRIHSAK